MRQQRGTDVAYTARWVKVDCYEKPEFLALPYAARALYRAMTPHLDPKGRLYVGPDATTGLATVLRATDDEIRGPLSKLVEMNFVVVEIRGTIFDRFYPQSSSEVNPAPSKFGSLDLDRDIDLDKEKKKISRGRPPGDPRHRPFIDKFYDLWGQLRGGRYEVQPKDARAVSGFLRSHPDTDMAEWERRLRLAFADSFFARTGSIAFFVSRWVNYDRVVSLVSPASNDRPRRRAVGVDDNGQPIFEDAK